MKKLKIPLIILISFLLGGVLSFAVLSKQVQDSHSRDLLLAYTIKLLSVDETALSGDTLVIRDLGLCLENMKACDLWKMGEEGSQYKQERVSLLIEQEQLRKQVAALNK